MIFHYKIMYTRPLFVGLLHVHCSRGRQLRINVYDKKKKKREQQTHKQTQTHAHRGVQPPPPSPRCRSIATTWNNRCRFLSSSLPQWIPFFQLKHPRIHRTAAVEFSCKRKKSDPPTTYRHQQQPTSQRYANYGTGMRYRIENRRWRYYKFMKSFCSAGDSLAGAAQKPRWTAVPVGVPASAPQIVHSMWMELLHVRWIIGKMKWQF